VRQKYWILKDRGDMESLQARYGRITETSGFIRSKRTKPAILFKPKIQPETKGI
jgi:hypothetical protein